MSVRQTAVVVSTTVPIMWDPMSVPVGKVSVLMMMVVIAMVSPLLLA